MNRSTDEITVDEVLSAVRCGEIATGYVRVGRELVEFDISELVNFVPRKEKQLDARQLQKRLGLRSVSSVYNLVNSGEIRSIRTGKVKGIMVYESDLNRYLTKNNITR